MSLTVRSKQELQNRIIEARIGIEMSRVILEQVKQFEHRKQVNKTFTDSFDALGYHAYITKDKWSSKLVVRKRVDDEGHSKNGAYTYVEFSLYRSEVMSKNPFSWEDIKKEVAKYDYPARLKSAEEALNVSDRELVEFEKFVNYVEQQDFKCVDIWRIKSDLKEALKDVKKNVAQ